MVKMNNDYVIETKQLVKCYSNRFKTSRAVNEVDLHVKKGSIYGLIGKNGAGKTTLMKIICGLARSDAGEVYLFGNNNISDELSYNRLGILIENPGIFPGMSAYENMKCKAICLGMNNYESKITEILELVGLKDVGIKHVGKFSLGMKQRLAIGIALLGEPDILVLDEPINGLDPQGIVEVREILLKLNKEKNITILISSHILEELSKLVTDFGIIVNGRLVQEISKDELMEKCHERMEIKTDNPDRAITVIEKMGIRNYKVINTDTLFIYERLEESGNINKELVMNDVDVKSILLNSESIEDYFLNVTGGIL